VKTEDKKLAAAGLRKQQAGKKPTREEAAAIRRVQRAKEEEARKAAYAAIPKKLWVEWSGRQYKQLADVVARYGAPLAGRSISLPEFVGWFHQWLVEVGPRITAAADEPGAIELERIERAKIRRLERRRLEGELVAVDEIARGMEAFAGHIRRAHELMVKRPDMTGAEAADELRRALENAKRDLQKHLPGPDDRNL
jgi:hypothetical protein